MSQKFVTIFTDQVPEIQPQVTQVGWCESLCQLAWGSSFGLVAGEVVLFFTTPWHGFHLTRRFGVWRHGILWHGCGVQHCQEGIWSDSKWGVWSIRLQTRKPFSSCWHLGTVFGRIFSARISFTRGCIVHKLQWSSRGKAFVSLKSCQLWEISPL